ncbi:MAG: hypothetical protein L0Z53_12790 [Acidobacteriales bacterium]|nr:hypothetical protein [Terriglobales bacterium]
MKGNRWKKEFAPLLIILLQSLIVVPPTLAQEKHSFAGTWKANWASPNRLESVSKKDGTVNGQSAYEVSADRKTLTASVKGIDGKGRPFEQVIVFDREERD